MNKKLIVGLIALILIISGSYLIFLKNQNSSHWSITETPMIDLIEEPTQEKPLTITPREIELGNYKRTIYLKFMNLHENTTYCSVFESDTKISSNTAIKGNDFSVSLKIPKRCVKYKPGEIKESDINVQAISNEYSNLSRVSYNASYKIIDINMFCFKNNVECEKYLSKKMSYETLEKVSINNVTLVAVYNK